MLISNRTKTPFNAGELAVLTLPWTQERFSRPYPFANRQRGMSGMGQDGIQLPSITDTINNTIDQGMTALNTAIANSIASGSGSTADPVPVQNAVLYNVLSPVSNALQMPVVTSHAELLNSLLSFLNAGQQAWNAWAQAHPSSRTTAAIQTLLPYFQRLNQAISTDLARLGASPSVIPGTNIPIPTDYTTSGISAGMMAIAAIALFYITQRK